MPKVEVYRSLSQAIYETKTHLHISEESATWFIMLVGLDNIIYGKIENIAPAQPFIDAGVMKHAYHENFQALRKRLSEIL